MSKNFAQRINIKGLDLNEINSLVKELGERPFHARQIYKWIYKNNAGSFDEMTDLSKKFRAKIKEHFILSQLKIVKIEESKIDLSRKYLFQLDDGNFIESVYMDNGKRITLCVSTMVGCPIKCPSCATGIMGLKRKLTAGEIIDQYSMCSRNSEKPITNIVFMGMGEPFLNYENSIKAAKIFNTELGPGISSRRITISTCGIIPGIKRFADEDQKFKLAISLNASNNEQRNKMIPVNVKYPLDDLLKSVKYYTKKTGKRPTFEYILIKDFNDTEADAKRLLKLLSPIPCKLNIIPFNESKLVDYQAPSEEELDEFLQKIYKAPFVVTVRRSNGQDISAACGQLYASESHIK